MQEAVFTDTIVLTHKDILGGNGIPGIGYSSYDDIEDEMLIYGVKRLNVFSQCAAS